MAFAVFLKAILSLELLFVKLANSSPSNTSMGEDHPKATMARAKQVRSKRKTPENFNLGGKGDLCAKTTEN
jgi:hypothetical protein